MTPARIFVLLSFILASALLLSGCTPVNTGVNFTHTFQGYPCNNHCDQFRAGFEFGQQQGYTSPAQCRSLHPNLQLGCLSYLHEYQLQTNQPAGYLF